MNPTRQLVVLTLLGAVSSVRADDRLGASSWHTAGHRGQGVKVAVLDTGFRGYREHLGRALPARVTARSFRADGDMEARDSQHGILCAEVLHTLAPEAELLLATWEPDRPDQFLDAVRWARAQGARVLSCSVIMPSWSDGEGGGPVHDTLRRLLAGAVCVASAGNTAERHWAGPFRDGGDGWHAWTAGVRDNEVTPWGGDPVSVELSSPVGERYEVVVHDAADGSVVGRKRGQGTSAVVRFVPKPGRGYLARVRHVEGAAGPFHLVVLGGGLARTTARGSIPFPADGPDVIAVGASDEAGRRVSYSSCGPNSSRPKPDFVAVVPVPSRWRDRPFGGTSAAAPQAAAAAALVWSRRPDWTAGQVRGFLEAAARDVAEPGHDIQTGHGVIALPPPR